MVLITGGSFQGKLEYALHITDITKEDIIDGATCEIDDLTLKPLVNHFHLFVHRMLLDSRDVYELLEQIINKNPDMVIIVDELGCGIVPIDPFDRKYREITGRICCKIAKEAKEVHWVNCGIGMVIKHA